MLLAAAFVLLAPASVATTSGVSEPAKYGRLLTTILIVGLGIASGRGLRVGRAGGAFIAFVVVFVLAGVWSGSPLYALFYKGMFALAFLSGIVVVNSVRSVAEFKQFLRLLGVVACGAAVMALAVYLRDPGASSRIDRMSTFGLNANNLGQTSANLLILCLYLALYAPRGRTQKAAWISCAALGLIILGTGSRGAVLMAGTGALFIVLPLARRPGVLLGVGLGVILIGVVGFQVLELSGGDRLIDDIDKNTRSSIWRFAIKRFVSSPVIGVGWMHVGTQWTCVQSAYIQTLAETGILGAGALLAALGAVGAGMNSNYRFLRRRRLPLDLLYLDLAMTSAVLLHGLFESALFVGSTLDPLFLGMGVGLCDRLPRLASQDYALPAGSRPSMSNIDPRVARFWDADVILGGSLTYSSLPQQDSCDEVADRRPD